MRLGIWTAYYLYPNLSLEDILRRLSGLGWKDVELSTEHIVELLQDADGQKRLNRARAFLEKEGIKAWQLHTKIDLNVAHPDLTQRAQEVDTALRCLEIAHTLDVPCAVIHPGGAQGYSSGKEREEIVRLNVQAFTRLCERAEKLGVRVCVENMGATGEGGRRILGGCIFELQEVIDQVGSEALGICFDTSHANLMKLDLPEEIRACGERLYATHISDNDGSGDQHRMPFCGNIDWTAVIGALKAVGYAGLFNLEIGGERCRSIEVQDAKLHYIKGVLEPMLTNIEH